MIVDTRSVNTKISMGRDDPWPGQGTVTFYEVADQSESNRQKELKILNLNWLAIFLTKSLPSPKF